MRSEGVNLITNDKIANFEAFYSDSNEKFYRILF